MCLSGAHGGVPRRHVCLLFGDLRVAAGVSSADVACLVQISSLDLSGGLRVVSGSEPVCGLGHPIWVALLSGQLDVSGCGRGCQS